MTKQKIVCHTCDGKKMIKELTYPERSEIEVPCPECDGEGWIWCEVWYGERFK